MKESILMKLYGAETLASESLYIYIYIYYVYYIKLKSRLSVCPSGMLITQQSLHQLKLDLLEMKIVALRIIEFIFTSLQECIKDKGVSSY